VKPVPDALTNPVSMGDGALDVGPALVVDGALDVGPVLVVNGALVEDTASGRHCEYQSFW